MNVDQQLVIGVVFIVAGLAVALLAYAAYLNREAPTEEADVAEAPVSPDVSEGAVGGAEPETRAVPNEGEAKADSAPDRFPRQGQEESAGPSEPDRRAEPLGQAPDLSGAAAISTGESNAQPTPTVQLLRNQETGRLNVKIEDRIYNSIEELRASHDWKRVDDLFSDILAWLVKEQPTMDDPESLDEQADLDRPLSMVDQINQILSEKLRAREGGPRAVRLMEGTGGNIRVYIGMDSYPMDEVPDEEVQAIIRQAVREWEARQ